MPLTINKLRQWISKDLTLDPFTRDFDRKKLENRLAAYKKFDKKAVDFLNFLLAVNQLYKAIVKDIHSELSKINLSEDELLSLLFKYLNEEEFRANIAFLKKLKTTTTIPDPETIHYQAYHGIDDDPLGVATSQQILVDATGEILKHIAELTVKVEVKLNDEDLGKSVRRLWMMGNVICNLRDTCYSQVIFERAYIEWIGKSSVKIVHEFPIIDKIRTVAEIRNSNRQFEVSAYMAAILDKNKEAKKKIKIKAVEKGEIKIEIASTDEMKQHIQYQSTLMKYHPQLANVQLDYFEGLTISAVLGLVGSLFELFENFKILEPGDNTDNQNVPVFVDYRSLVSTLAESSNSKEKLISKLIDAFCGDPKAPYFWRNPFYKSGNKLFFPVHAVSVPNVHLFIDKIVTLEQITPARQLQLFKEFSVYESQAALPMEYEFSVFTPDLQMEDANIFQNNICYVTRDIVLLTELFLFPYPIESIEHGNVLNGLNRASLLAKEKSNLLKQNFPDLVNGKKLLPCVITDYPIYSGLGMNKISTLDFGLLHHYFFKGSMSKMTTPFDKDGHCKSTEFAKLRYYTNENEFNNGIENFISHPPPVHQLLSNMKIGPVVITPPYLPLQVTVDKVNFIGEQNALQEKINELEDLMVYEHFGEPKGSDETALNEKIQYELATVLHKLAFARYTPYEERWRLINAAAKSSLVGNAHLLFLLIQSSGELPANFVKHTNTFKTVPVAEDMELYDRLEQYLGKEVSLLDFEIPDIFSATEEVQLISTAIALIDHSAYQKIDDKDINFLVLNLMILSGFRKKYPLEDHFHTACMNFTDMLNLSHHYQKARDFSEELLLVSISLKEQWFGWYILFTCYSSQNNFREAALYGSLFFTAIKYFQPIKYRVLLSGAFALMKFFRNFHYYEYGISTYDAFLKIDLDETDKLKLGQVYFSMLALQLNTNPEKMDEIFDFIDDHFEAITKYSTRSTTPWLALLYNLKRYISQGRYQSRRPIEEYISRLELNTDENIVQVAKSKIFGDGESSKMRFIETLLVVFETRETSDLVNELSNLTLPAFNLIRESFASVDAEGILMAALVLSDQSYVYLERPIQETRAPLIKERDAALDYKLRNYLKYYLSQVNFRSGQVLLWIFAFEEEYGYLVINWEKKVYFEKLPQWMEKELIEWTRKISKFYFNADSAKLVDYDLGRQERDYNRVLNFFSKASLPEISGMTELMICKSLEMTDIPHNLLVTGDDFIAAAVPVCNVLSPEYFLLHNDSHKIVSDFSVQAWIPVDEENQTIQIGYARLEPVLNCVAAEVITSHYPENPLSGDINIFLAHGVRKLGGFKAVRTADGPLSSILQPSRVFGKGSIAVLFICNAGSVVEDTYAMQVSSLSTQLLKSDYHAVVAPYWPYDVTMSDRWLSVFLKSLKQGDFVNHAVFKANKQLAEYDADSTTVFLAPEGQFAMHLYGNPNIRIDLK